MYQLVPLQKPSLVGLIFLIKIGNQKSIFVEFHKVIVLFSTLPETNCSCE
jgi:hypothetical protein